MRTLAYSFSILAGSLAMGCSEPPEYEYGMNLQDLVFEVTDPQMGIHPNMSVLQEPNNPFAAGMGPETKWMVESHAVAIPEYSGSVARFYSWATILARQTIGENQFYTAQALRDMYLYEEAEPSDLVFVRQMALDAFVSVLENFPDSVSYDVTGVYSYPLAPLAYQGIIDLGGTPPAGWIMFETEDGPVVLKQEY